MLSQRYMYIHVGCKMALLNKVNRAVIGVSKHDKTANNVCKSLILEVVVYV